MYYPNGRAAAAIHQRGSAKPRTKPERGITAHTPTASAARGWDCSIPPRRDFSKPRYSTQPDHKEVDVLLAANGVWIWTTLAIILWIAIAFWPARVAARKGHSFFLYFLFSLVFFPAALLVAYMVSDRTAAA